MSEHSHEYHDTPQRLAAMGDDLHHEELFDAEGHFVGKHHEEHHHVTPFWPMFLTLAILVVLTIVTVYTAKFIHLPAAGNLILALVIACIKGTLVAAFFMHLLYDKAVNTVIVIATLFAILLFLGLTIGDISARKIHEPLESGEIVHGGGAKWIEEDGKRKVQWLGEYNPQYSAQPSKSVLEYAREAYHAAGGHREAEHGADDHSAEEHPPGTGDGAQEGAADDAHANTPATTQEGSEGAADDAPKANSGGATPH